LIKFIILYNISSINTGIWKNSYGEEEFKKIASFEKDTEQTDSEKKFDKRRDIHETMQNLDKIDEEIKKEAEETKKIAEESKETMNIIIENKITSFINEEHFEGDTKKYREFLDAYIH